MGKSIIISSKSPDFMLQTVDKLKSEYNILSNNFADIFEISIQEKQSIGINEIRTLKCWVVNKPFRSTHKIALIYNAEKLTPEAQNSLLKILEEPNPSLIIILATTNYQKLLSTVISRCELVLDSAKLPIKSTEDDFLSMNLLDKLKKIETVNRSKKKKQIFEEILVNLLDKYEPRLTRLAVDTKILENVKLINETKKKIEANVPAKMAMINLIMNFNWDQSI